MAHDHAHDHPPHLAHHFDTPQQQFESGKLGMWLFLATEILLFGGLFCAYAVYRYMYPEVFDYAHQYLDKVMGGINTVVLICSSFTMAWAVRCAQTENRKGLILGLALTLLGGAGFMGIKYVEYAHKIHDGLLPGTYYDPGGHDPESLKSAREAKLKAAAAAVATEAAAPQKTADGKPIEQSTIAAAPRGPKGLRKGDGIHTETPEKADEHAAAGHVQPHGERPEGVWWFFGIYFLMTGLHGFHVLAGMGVIGWLLYRSIKGHFNKDYFAPVDLGGLYWHLVDLIWIYLFPLLYLIG